MLQYFAITASKQVRNTNKVSNMFQTIGNAINYMQVTFQRNVCYGAQIEVKIWLKLLFSSASLPSKYRY